MKIKSILIALVAILLLVGIVFLIVLGVTREKDYTAHLIAEMEDEQMVTAKNVFSFKFHKAYVFDDPYISGEDFAKKHGLNISISQVKSGTSENIQRIVFVDDLGHFVYEFKCDSGEVLIAEKGIVIYPETVIERLSPEGEKSLKITFKSMEKYDK